VGLLAEGRVYTTSKGAFKFPDPLPEAPLVRVVCPTTPSAFTKAVGREGVYVVDANTKTRLLSVSETKRVPELGSTNASDGPDRVLAAAGAPGEHTVNELAPISKVAGAPLVAGIFQPMSRPFP